jgi:uncharacterized membrane protein
VKLRLLQLYDALTNSFWFVPSIMAVLAAVTALGSVALDQKLNDDFITSAGWIWSGSATGARSVLSTVAGSVMTVVSVVFSITVTALAMMSSQFGPRILLNFTSDRGNQITLGTFIATFIYCLVVLRTVRSVEESPFVPHLAVTIGVGMAITSLAVLIYFIHHISQSLQVEHLIAGVGHEFQQLLPLIFPQRIGHDKEEVEKGKEKLSNGIDWDDACIVVATDNGYIQRIDDTRLMKIACEWDLVVQLERRPGDFVIDGSILLKSWPSIRMDEGTKQRLADCFSFGSMRTPYQDVRYPLQQLVEIALHALSPGINEPFTALSCIDWLGASLRSVATRVIPSTQRYDHNKVLRVIAHPFHFEELAAIAFDQIRLYGCSNPDVVIRLLDTIGGIAPHLSRDGDRQTLIRHVTLIREDAQQITNLVDRQRVDRHLRQVLLQLSAVDGQDVTS